MRYDVKLTASPGIPWSDNGGTNKILFENHSGRVIDAVIERLRLRMDTPVSVCLKMSAREKVEKGLCDPVRTFVKDEPHSAKKRATGRWRLISSVSIVDQLCERMTCSAQNKAEIKRWETIPSAPGISLTDEALGRVWERFKGKMADRDMAAADVTGFDWSVRDWEMFSDARRRIYLMDADSEVPTSSRYRSHVCYIP